MEGDFAGVRIQPPLVEIRDTETNRLHSVNISVKNISKISRAIRYYGPQTKHFRLKVKNPEKPVAPGLEVAAVVEYETADPTEHKDRLVVTVDDEVIEIPLLAYPCRPNLELDGSVKFGNVVASSKVIAKEIPLVNHGSKAGDFKIKYCGSKPIAVVPSSGTVPPKSVQIIKVEYVTKSPGKFDEIAKVKLEGCEPGTLHITGNVVEGNLELLSPHSEEPIECVKFGATYYGTDRTESAYLYNNGPEPASFVAILQEDAIGQEVGVDLTKSTAATLADRDNKALQQSGVMNDLASLVTVLPNQGILGPYEKMPVFFRFSPRWNRSQQGFLCSRQVAPRKDFALFMHFKMIGASKGFQESGKDEKSNVEGSSKEVALTGTALPVMLSVSPQTRFDFGECPVGEHVDTLCTLRNESPSMPVTYEFRRVAHFIARPSSGKIKPGEQQEVILSFQPNQVGTFKPTQLIDIIGQVADNENPFLMHLEVIQSVPVQFQGKSDPVTVKKGAKFNPGITPKITNEVGLFVDTSVAGAHKTPRNAMHNAQGTKLHRHSAHAKMMSDRNTLVSFPNDRSRSVRPSNRKENYKTIFTHTERHTYVDPDYSYTDEEIVQVQNHKQSYIDFIDTLRETRKNKKRSKEFNETNNSMDIAIKPAAGLKPKKLTVEEVGPDPSPPSPPNARFKMLSSKELKNSERKSAAKFRDGLNAVPISNREKADCARVLSPQDLYQVIIGPPIIDFGEVCLRSICHKELSIVNNLDQYIHVNVQVDCRELRQTSPLSQVVPPRSKAALPLIFESNVKGRFQRSLEYSVNGFYKHHVTVLAEVVPVALELSTEELILEPSLGLPAEAGIRGIITIQNKRNYPAEFTWSPILGDRGTAFSIRPATGSVDPCSDLACEVVFHPSYAAPDEGQFQLKVHGGEALQLKCVAKFGSTGVQFIDRRIMFGQVPLHLTTTKTAMMKNSGHNHAYFQVLDPNPFPGLTVSPVHGVVPVGGHAELKVALTPDAVIKFDTRVNINFRGWKTLELRVGGTVEPPCVDIDLSSFSFGGVYCGSSASTNFKLINKANTRAKLEFDLSRYRDFSLKFPWKQTSEDQAYQQSNPGMYTVTLDPDDVVECEMLFQPTEVAAYDFFLPVTINQTGAPTPAATPFPPTPTPSNKNSIQHIINPRPVYVPISTPKRKVVATALRQPLQISTHQLEFSMSRKYHELATSSGLGKTKTPSKCIVLVNNSMKELKWNIDINQNNKCLEEGVFKFLHSSGMPYLSQAEGGIGGYLDPGQTMQLGVLFCPSEPGHYETRVPVILNEDFSAPYQYISLLGDLKSAQLWFDPLAVVFTQVPLDTEVSADFRIYAANYTKVAYLEAEGPEVECEDGSKVSPLTVTFVGGKEIKACAEDEGEVEPETVCIPCKVSFKSNKPVSFTENITFTDSEGNRFPLPVTATADNCLLTCYPFLAQHRSDHQIVCVQGSSLRGRKTASRESMNAGEAILRPCESPHRASSRPSTSATSSNFQCSSSSYESSSQSITDSPYPSTPRDGALNKIQSDSDENSRSRNDIHSRSLGSALFPDEDSEEGIFHTEVLVAVQRWFSAQGWPGGPFPISIPYSLRSGISKKPSEEKAKNSKGGTWEANNLKKEFKTVYDMVGHLCGRPVPGIPINNPLPREPIERAKQVYWQHTTLLTFIRTQGGCVSSIKPEYLMEPQDYKAWMALQRFLEAERIKDGVSEVKVHMDEDEAMEDALFEAVSKRAWTDVLLQLYKTLVLARITPRQFRNMPSPYKESSLPTVDPDPVCSNVYSISERILLLWLNHNYEQQRHRIWQNCPKGGVPPSRWIVNFDFDLLDGLVLGAVLGAHVPFLIKTHLNDMYTHHSTAEQGLHNALKVVNALQYIGIDYDIQAIDITDPNPIAMLFLLVHLYQKLPQYLPKNSVEFAGTLHIPCVRQVRLTNPSNKPLTYTAMVAGKDARDFSLPKGDTVTIAPRGKCHFTVEYRSRYLRPAEAVLVLVGRRQGSNVGSTMVFSLKTQIDNIDPKGTMKIEYPCYELHKVCLDVINPFAEAGTFKIVLVESRMDHTGQGTETAGLMQKGKARKSKKVRSRIDYGQSKPKTPEDLSPSPLQMLEQAKEPHPPQEESAGTALSAFYSPEQSVYLEGHGSALVDLHFLPFQMGRRQCSVIFISEEVGEFLYSIEANATAPKSSGLPFKPGPHSVRISSAVAAGRGRGTYGGSAENVVYWKCEVGQKLQESLSIPITNEAREQALVLAAQQQMSNLELERRRVTNTLASATLTAKAIDTLSAKPPSASRKPKSAAGRGVKFTVEIDSEFFTVPDQIHIPHPAYRPQSSMDTTDHGQQADRSMEDGTVDLPVTFKAKEAGHYPCKIVLSSPDDVRVYQIDCTVIPGGSEAYIEFTCPVHQPITQDIPVVNESNHDWQLEATIEGAGFVGPTSLVAKAFQTTYYPLMFRPQLEGDVEGKLTLTNTSDSVEHVFFLRGQGEQPLPLDKVKITCQAKQTVTQTFNVPNVTRKKLYYRAETDLQCVSGPTSLTVLPGQTGKFEAAICPLKRGQYKGVLTFVAGGNPVKEVDSDGDEIPESDDEEELRGYRVWYAVTVEAAAPVPEKILDLVCACQKKAVLEIGVTNPLDEEITFEATVSGNGLSGPSELTLPAKSRGIYELIYFPAVIGQSKGSLILYHDATGEFWYDLNLLAESPMPTTLPHMQCELGKWIQQYLTLNNPTEEMLELIPTVSNINNFALERDNERPIVLRPKASLNIPLNFMPSTLGEGDHRAAITFHCEQFPELGEWVFLASGSGTMPQPQDPVNVTAIAGSNSTLIVPFRNPMDIPVLVDISLTDKQEKDRELLGNQANTSSPFCLLLKYTEGLRVGPKSTLDIPISFAPEDMKMYEAVCKVRVRKEDRSSWHYNLSEESGGHLPRSRSGGISEVHWIYPINGYPELTIAKDLQAAVIECQARERVEERLEVTLSGVVPSTGGPQKGIRARAVTPKNERPRIPDGVVVGETLAVAEEFTYELSMGDQEAEKNVGPAVALSLVRQQRDQSTGVLVLVFNIIYAPYKVMRHDVHLLVKAATGGIWRFPLRFVATEPEPDDMIVIEATGLNKESIVGFRLTSQAKHPVPYNAFFLAGSDREFMVTPQTGELLPQGSNGTLIKVSFIPEKYGKVYQGKLVVQATDMQWTYNIRGVPPGYSPPRGFSSRPMAGPHPDPRQRLERINYIKDNLRLTTTAVSSPIKGAPLLKNRQVTMFT